MAYTKQRSLRLWMGKLFGLNATKTSSSDQIKTNSLVGINSNESHCSTLRALGEAGIGHFII